MPRFFVTAANLFGGSAYIRGQDAAHFRVLRIRDGELFTVCDGKGTDYLCRLRPDGAEDGDICAEILDEYPSPGEPAVTCTVYAAFSKGDKMDTVVQKSVELGANQVVAFPASRCVSRPTGAALLRKVDRWQKIAYEAAKQSGRGIVPQVLAMDSFKGAVAAAAEAELPLFLYEEEKQLGLRAALEQGKTCKTISIFTGPEGGCSSEEAQQAIQQGMKPVSLGPRILRCETAPVSALCAVMLYTGNMEYTPRPGE